MSSSCQMSVMKIDEMATKKLSYYGKRYEREKPPIMTISKPVRHLERSSLEPWIVNVEKLDA